MKSPLSTIDRSIPGRSIVLVVTTISRGGFLARLAQAVRAHAGPERIRLCVVGDVNTPPECKREVERLAGDGIAAVYMGLDAQEAFLRPFPGFGSRLRTRSDERRNVGFLLALRDGCDVLVSVDDDNLPIEGSPFFAEHATAGTEVALPGTSSRNGWFNLGCLLETRDFGDRPTLVYPRGFPYARRGTDASALGETRERGTVAVNVGLWSGAPDVDAITHLAAQPRVSAPPHWMSALLGPGQRTPINTQNTALMRQAIVSYFFVRMGAVLHGSAMGRFGDIFSGYFCQLCVEAVGQRVRLGAPWVHQDRNEHDLLRDLRAELPAIELVERLVPLFEQPLSPTSSYLAAYRELADRIAAQAEGQPTDVAAFFTETAQDMRLWARACIEVAGGEAAFTVGPGRD